MGMFEPPSGHEDMLADAERVTPSPILHDLEVPRVGVVRARRPMPGGAAALGMSANSKVSATSQADHLNRFVKTHLGDDEYERLLAKMVEGDMSDNVIGLVARAIATWGTARPYVAVITLCAATATHWRLLRPLYHSHGIHDPLTQLPSLHSLLDDTEKMCVEAMADDPKTYQARRSEFLDRLYAPDTSEAAELNDDGYKPVPAGFENPADVHADFGAAMRALTGGGRRRAR